MLSGWHRVEDDRDESYEGDWQGGKLTGYGEWFSPSRGSYAGEWSEHLYHGKGKFRFASGECYEGEFERDESFEGDWQGGKLTGYGEWFSPSRGSYAGEWSEHLYHGKGKFRFASGECYEGEGPVCTCHGMPVMQLSGWHRVEERDESFEGDWQGGKLTGYGEWFSPSRGSYAGEWSEQLYHGKGKFTFPSGEKFQGEFNKGCPLFGTLINTAGSDYGIYRGYWSHGNMHGDGAFTWPEGHQFEGNFELEGNHEVLYSNGRLYIGGWKDGLWSGRGMIGGSLCQYEGNFEAGEPSGFGRAYWKDSNRTYMGQFKQGDLHGAGTFIEEDGSRIRGTFRRGAL
ncbi:hypothetical protein GUITHDRAFT_78453, partial [Guillardia theta CCMP2712]